MKRSPPSKRSRPPAARRARKPAERESSAPAENFRATRAEHASELAEDYVEAIAGLLTEHGEARVVDLAKRLGVTHVTVARSIARLQRDGLVISRPYRSIFLTEKGAALAEKCRARHEVVVAFLRAIGVPSAIAQRDAEGIEHHVSPETLAAFRRIIAKAARPRSQRATGKGDESGGGAHAASRARKSAR